METFDRVLRGDRHNQLVQGIGLMLAPVTGVTASPYQTSSNNSRATLRLKLKLLNEVGKTVRF